MGMLLSCERNIATQRMLSSIRCSRISHTFRILRRDIGFAFFAILIVGLGIGASAIVFSVLNTRLLRPLPFKDAESLVWIANRKTVPEQTTQVGHILDAREANQSFTELAAYYAYYNIGDRKLTDAGEPERLPAVPVSENFFACSASSLSGRCHATKQVRVRPRYPD